MTDREYVKAKHPQAVCEKVREGVYVLASRAKRPGEVGGARYLTGYFSKESNAWRKGAQVLRGRRPHRDREVGHEEGVRASLKALMLHEERLRSSGLRCQADAMISARAVLTALLS